MSEDRLARDLAELPDGGGPRPGWEGRVLATARVPAMARPPRRSSLAFAVAGAGVVVLASILFFALRPDPVERAEKAAAARLDQLVRDMESTQRDLDRLIAEKDAELQKLLEAGTEEERMQRQEALRKKNELLAAKERALKSLRARAKQDAAGARPPTEPDGVVKVKCDPNDPLCGL